MNFVISLNTIILFFLSMMALWLLLQVAGIIILLFVALLLSFALLPFVNVFRKRGLSRGLSTALVYFLFVLAFLIILSAGISPILSQTTVFLSNLPRIIQNLIAGLASREASPYASQLVEEFAKQLANASGSILRITLGVFSSFLALVSVVVFSFYFSLEYEYLREKFLDFFPGKTRSKLSDTWDESEQKIGSWVRGEFVLMAVIFLMTYVGLTLLRVNYALPLAVIAGTLEIVPVIGPVVSAIPAMVVGFASGSWQGFGVAALFVVVQQLENNLIVPRVMQKAVGLNPLVTMVAILVGGKVFGFVGALLAVPVTLVIQTILSKFVLTEIRKT